MTQYLESDVALKYVSGVKGDQRTWKDSETKCVFFWPTKQKRSRFRNSNSGMTIMLKSKTACYHHGVLYFPNAFGSATSHDNRGPTSCGQQMCQKRSIYIKADLQNPLEDTSCLIHKLKVRQMCQKRSREIWTYMYKRLTKKTYKRGLLSRSHTWVAPWRRAHRCTWPRCPAPWWHRRGCCWQCCPAIWHTCQTRRTNSIRDV